MRRLRLLAFILLACVASSVAGVPAASARPKTNWALLTFKARYSAEFSISQRLRVHLRGRGPWVLGFAGSVLGDGPFGDFSYAFVFSLGGNEVSARTSGGAGGVNQQLAPVVDIVGRGGGVFDISSFSEIPLRAGQRFSTLMFVPNTSLEVSSSYVDPWYAVTGKREPRGSGSTAMLVAGKTNKGVAVSAGPVAAGSTTYAAKTPGLVGAIEAQCNCQGSWRGPGGRRGSWSALTGDGFISPIYYWDGDLAFAGPPGRWAWDWTGASDAYQLESQVLFGPSTPPTPIIGAWAPIGDDWRLFRKMHPSGFGF